MPPGVLPLPEPSDGPVFGSIISSDNATFYKEIIVPEIYRLIRFNGAVLDAARRVKYGIKFDDAWNAGTASLAKVEKKIGADGALDFSFPRTRGFIFGDDATLLPEWKDLQARLSKNKDADQGAFAQKILWNMNSGLWSKSLIEYHFRLLWLKQGKAWRNVRGSFLRVYPWMLDPNFKLPQMFREKFSFYYPEPLHGLSWLTFRFQNADEDLVWAYSPAIQKVRQLTSSNRSDSLITSGLAADDFLAFSSNPTFSNAKALARLVTLVPFPSPVVANLDDKLQPCYRLPNPGSGGSDQALWNFETPKFPGAADWLPIKAVWVPREVYKIEVTTKDPYSLYGREVLYVDTETMLPVYKIVFDRAGRYWKTIIAAWGYASTTDRKRRTMYPGFEIILDVLNNKEFVMDYAKLRYCDSYPQDIDLSSLEPKRLTP